MASPAAAPALAGGTGSVRRPKSRAEKLADLIARQARDMARGDKVHHKAVLGHDADGEPMSFDTIADAGAIDPADAAEVLELVELKADPSAMHAARQRAGNAIGVYLTGLSIIWTGGTRGTPAVTRYRPRAGVPCPACGNAPGEPMGRGQTCAVCSSGPDGRQAPNGPAPETGRAPAPKVRRLRAGKVLRGGTGGLCRAALRPA